MSMPMPMKSAGLVKQTQTIFGGLNASPSAQEGEIVEMLNLTTDLYPRMSVRKKRTNIAKLTEPGGMVWLNGDLFFKEGTSFCRRNLCDRTEETIWVDEEMVDMVVIGNYMIAKYIGDPFTLGAPEDVYRYAEGLYDGEPVWGKMNANHTAVYGTSRGISFGSYGVSAGGNTIVIQTGATAYEDLSEDLRAGDCVTISGCTRHPANNKSAVIQSFGAGSEHPTIFTDNCFELDTIYTHTVPTGGYAETDLITSPLLVIGDTWYSVGFSAAVSAGTVIEVDGNDAQNPTVTPASCFLQAGGMGATEVDFTAMEREYTEPTTVTITRSFPHLDFMFVHDNRLMGAIGDTIYVSAPGDPFNFEKFEGLASDSWTTDTGTPGEFVGGIVYGGYPRFLKADAIYTLYGDYAGEYTLSRQDCTGLGLEPSSGKSLAVCNGALYYLSRKGVCAYAGSDPVLVGGALGTEYRENGIAASDGVKYYLETGTTEKHLFVLDTEKSTWVESDGLGVIQMNYGEGRVWYLTEEGMIGAFGINGRDDPPPAEDFTDGVTQEGILSWYAEFREVTAGTPDKKKVNEMQIRARLAAGASLTVRMSYDGGEFETVAHREAMEETMCILPLRPKRFDRCTMRLEGAGYAEIESITKKYAAGSARRGG